MKLTNKIALLSAMLLAAVAVTFTGCNFGKDDFYGTWQSGVFARPSDGKSVRVTFYFSGKSENLTSGDKAYFYEIYENLDDNLYTFWWGTYGLGNNADVTNGTLTLRYMYGVRYKDGNGDYYSVDELITASNKKKLADAASAFEGTNGFCAEGSTAPTWFDQYDKTNQKCSDVEKFDFKLDGAVAFQGYTQMVCTAISQWWEDGVAEGEVTVGAAAGSTKKNPAEGTSWGAAGVTRSFSLTNDNGASYGDTLDTTSSNNVVPAVSTPSLSTAVGAGVRLTPEK